MRMEKCIAFAEVERVVVFVRSDGDGVLEVQQTDYLLEQVLLPSRAE
jgi:hypothetical protein